MLNASLALAEPQYTLVDLGSLGGDWTIAYGINAVGDVVGVSTTTVAGPQHAFLGTRVGHISTFIRQEWRAPRSRSTTQDELWVRIPAITRTASFYQDGQVTGMPGSVVGTAVNQAGAVAGTAFMPYQSPMLYVNGSVRDISPFSPAIGLATDVNNLGHAVGYASGLEQGAPNQAFFYNGQTSSLLSLPAAIYSAAYGVNDHDAVVGEMTVARDSGAAPVAFYLHDGLLQQIGDLGLNISGARDINNQGQIVGWSYTSASQLHGFLFQDGTTFDLNNLLKEPSGFQSSTPTRSMTPERLLDKERLMARPTVFCWSPFLSHTHCPGVNRCGGVSLRHRFIRLGSLNTSV